MRCETALTLSHWLKETAEPALEVAKPGRKITVVNNAPGYSCRLRNNADTGKISEHALAMRWISQASPSMTARN